MKMNRRTMFKAGASLFLSNMMWNTRDVWGDSGSRKLYSLHIGLNDVDYDKYTSGGIRLGPLKGCIQDAKTYRDLVEKEKGFRSISLLSDAPSEQQRPTAKNVYGHIVWAADKLTEGDLFVVTYAGHGSNVPDTSSPPDEDDRRDETLCLYDRMLLDDELALMWGQFREGVRIVFISDSCSSGTVARAPKVAEGLARGLEVNNAEATKLFGDKNKVDRSVTAAKGMKSSESDSVRSRGAATHVSNAIPIFRCPSEAEAEAAFAAQRDILLQKNAETRIGDGRGASLIRASGVLLAACQDDEFAQEVAGHGLFTKSLAEVIAGSGTYRDWLLNAGGVVRRLSGQRQEPKLFPFGKEKESEKLLDQKPLTK